MNKIILIAAMMFAVPAFAQVQTTSCDILEQYCPIAATLQPTDAPCYLFDDAGQHEATLREYELFCNLIAIPEDMPYMVPILLLLVEPYKLSID